jgi:hypothetical protein
MRFMVFHTLDPGMTREQVEDIARATQLGADVKGVRSYLNLTEGRGVCIYDAPGRERLAQWMRSQQLPWDSIVEVELESEGSLVREPPAAARASASLFGDEPL